MKYVKRIEYGDKNLIIESVSGFYDHPMSGFANYDGTYVWFECGYRDKHIHLFYLGPIELIHKKWNRFLFERLIGRHWRYGPDGKRARFYTKEGRALGAWGFNQFYHGKLFKSVVKLSWLSVLYRNDTLLRDAIVAENYEGDFPDDED